MHFHAETAREFLEDGVTVQAICTNFDACHHWANLSMPVLIQRIGWEADMDLAMPIIAQHLFCSQCGARNPRVRRVRIAQSPSSPQRSGGVHPSSVMPFDEAMERSVELSRLAAAADAGRFKGQGRWRRFGKR